jgi:hypothetical protein
MTNKYFRHTVNSMPLERRNPSGFAGSLARTCAAPEVATGDAASRSTSLWITACPRTWPAKGTGRSPARGTVA